MYALALFSRSLHTLTRFVARIAPIAVLEIVHSRVKPLRAIMIEGHDAADAARRRLHELREKLPKHVSELIIPPSPVALLRALEHDPL